MYIKFNPNMLVSGLTLPTSEIFMSIEGEGPFNGVPMLFIRSFGCNFTCSGFNNPSRQEIEVPSIDKLEDFVPERGCDSIYSWHPHYKKFVTKYSVTDLAAKISQVVKASKEDPTTSAPTYFDIDPENVTWSDIASWSDVVDGNHAGPSSEQDETSNETKDVETNSVSDATMEEWPAISITGGEPMLHQKFWTDFFFKYGKHISLLIIETNAAVLPRPNLIRALNKIKGLVVWANSPKLSNSGECHERAIRPQVLADQQLVLNSTQYLKFVSPGTTESFDEIESVFEEYQVGIDRLASTDPTYKKCSAIKRNAVYVMPEGSTRAQQEQVQRKVAEKCIKHGVNFCARVHCFVFDNAVGT